MSTTDMTHAEKRVRTSQTVRVLLWLVVVAAIVVFALKNTERVTVDWIARNAQVPLWAVIAVSAVAGVLIGSLRRPHRS